MIKAPAPIEEYNPEAEQCLLGALLVKNDTYKRIADITKPEHFYYPAHRIIFEEIKKRLDNGESVDFRLLKCIADDPYISATGGLDYISTLASNVIPTTSVVDFAKAVKNDYICRRIEEITSTYTSLKDGPSALLSLEKELYSLRENETDQHIKPLSDGLNEALDWITDVKSGDIKPIKSGIAALDRIISGFYPGRLYVLAARPGMGKSVMALNLAESAARYNKVLLFSLEMNRAEIARRTAARHTGHSVQKQFEAHDLNPHQIGEIRNTPIDPNIWIDDRSGLTIQQIYHAAKRFRGLGMVIIDYLGLIRTDGDRPMVQKIAEITVECKRMSKELGVPVILLSQLNRGVEDRENKRPMLSDLRDSGAIEQDADVVMFIYREEYYLEREEEKVSGRTKGPTLEDRKADAKDKAEIIIAKNRQGKNLTANVGFNGEKQFFYDK